MSIEDDSNGGKRKSTRAELAVSWAKAVSLLVATSIAVYAAAFKGEPGADEAKNRVDKTWTQMQREVRKMTKAYDKLYLRVLTLQAREEGHTSGALMAKLDQLQLQYNKLVLAKAKPNQVKALLTRMNEKPVQVKAVKAAKSKPTSAPAMPAPPWRKK